MKEPVQLPTLETTWVGFFSADAATISDEQIAGFAYIMLSREQRGGNLDEQLVKAARKARTMLNDLPTNLEHANRFTATRRTLWRWIIGAWHAQTHRARAEECALLLLTLPSDANHELEAQLRESLGEQRREDSWRLQQLLALAKDGHNPIVLSFFARRAVMHMQKFHNEGLPGLSRLTAGVMLFG